MLKEQRGLHLLPVAFAVLLALRRFKKWQYTMSMLGPNTCSDSCLCQLHISIYKLSPSVLRYHVGVVSSVCFSFAILLHWVILNTRESALIRDQPSLNHSFITLERREELRNYVHPHQGWVFEFSLLISLLKDQVCYDANKNDASVWQPGKHNSHENTLYCKCVVKLRSTCCTNVVFDIEWKCKC